MTYVVIHGRGLAGLHTVGRVHGLGAVTGTSQLADGSTPGSREIALAHLSVLVADWKAKLQGVLDGQLSISSCLFQAGPLFSMQTAAARASIVRARDQLPTFLEAAAGAMRDYNRNINEVSDVCEAYLDGVALNLSTSLKIEERGRLKSVMKQAITEAKNIVKDGAEAAATIVDLPWWVAPAVGIFALAYVARSVR